MHDGYTSNNNRGGTPPGLPAGDRPSRSCGSDRLATVVSTASAVPLANTTRSHLPPASYQRTAGRDMPPKQLRPRTLLGPPASETNSNTNAPTTSEMPIGSTF